MRVQLDDDLVAAQETLAKLQPTLLGYPAALGVGEDKTEASSLYQQLADAIDAFEIETAIALTQHHLHELSTDNDGR